MHAVLPSFPHLRALAYSALAAAMIFEAGLGVCGHLVHRRVHALAPEIFPIKNQGVLLQRQAFESGDLLPLYGSSELVKPIPNRASRFFRRYPTDFEVFPVGKAGTTSLIILQKLAGIGPQLRGKKVAISVSPSWFLTPQIPTHYYAGNFSKLQADEFTFASGMSWELKRDVARRMLEFPETLARSSVLRFALQRIANGTMRDRVFFALVWPVGWIETELLRVEDDFQTAAYILEQGRMKNPHRLPHELDWPTFLLHAAMKVSPNALRAEEPGGDWQISAAQGDTDFLLNLHRANEWRDFELLLRSLHEAGAEPLVLTMPLNGSWFDRLGVSKAARTQYFERLHALTHRYAVPLCDFQDHENDPRFLADHHDHLSIEGWMYYNQALDEFFHGKVPGS